MKTNFNPRRCRDLVLGVLAALFAAWLAGCDGVGPGEGDAGPAWPVPGTGLHVTDAGVRYCDVPSPSGDVQYTYSDGTKSPYTMRQWFGRAAEAGSVSLWSIVENAGDFAELCAEAGGSAGECEAGTRDFVEYCFGLECSSSQTGVTCRFGAASLLGRWNGDSRRVYGPVCDPQGRFVGWQCQF